MTNNSRFFRQFCICLPLVSCSSCYLQTISSSARTINWQKMGVNFQQTIIISNFSSQTPQSTPNILQQSNANTSMLILSAILKFHRCLLHSDASDMFLATKYAPSNLVSEFQVDLCNLSIELALIFHNLMFRVRN